MSATQPADGFAALTSFRDVEPTFWETQAELAKHLSDEKSMKDAFHDWGIKQDKPYIDDGAASGELGAAPGQESEYEKRLDVGCCVRLLCTGVCVFAESRWSSKL